MLQVPAQSRQGQHGQIPLAHTLQLLPGTDRPSYAGAAVNVLEGLDGRLAVQHEERDHPITGSATASECPPGLRRENHALTHHPSAHQWSGY